MVSRIVRTCSVVAIVSLAASVTACGSKGDLFLPRPAIATSTPATAATPATSPPPSSPTSSPQQPSARAPAP